MHRKYFPLHAHLTDGSIGDSILTVENYVQRAKAYGVDILAMTDHGSLSAMYHFYNECVKNHIKPIIGIEIEVYDYENCSLVLLAKNQKGLSNLIQLHNLSQIENFNDKPQINLKQLQNFGEGLIGISDCAAEKKQECEQIINDFKKCLDEFFLEIQPGYSEKRKFINDVIIKLAIKTETPIVVTNDIHYLNQDDWQIYDAHSELTQNMPRCLDRCSYFMHYEGLKLSIPRSQYVTDKIIDIAVDNAHYIAEKCNVTLSPKLIMPKFSKLGNEDKILSELCFKKLKEQFSMTDKMQQYSDRLYQELKIISDKGFSGYFLIVQDYINFARKNNIAVGPGRGSAAGSLVAYLLGISQADPIKYNLLFERFLDPNRNAVPDIDVDLSPEGRDKVFNYLIKRYGKNCCALVSTFNFRKARGALKDSARLFGVPTETANKITKLIPYVHYGDDGEKLTDLSIEKAVEISDDLKKWQKKYPEVFNLAKKLEGLPSSTGIHAAGILISPYDLTNMLPLIRTDKEILATSLDLQDTENCFVKFDLLSLATLSVIANTEKDTNFKFNYRDEKIYNDAEVWNIIGSKNTTGIFQISSSIYKNRMPRLRGCFHKGNKVQSAYE